MGHSRCDRYRARPVRASRRAQNLKNGSHGIAWHPFLDDAIRDPPRTPSTYPGYEPQPAHAQHVIALGWAVQWALSPLDQESKAGAGRRSNNDAGREEQRVFGERRTQRHVGSGDNAGIGKPGDRPKRRFLTAVEECLIQRACRFSIPFKFAQLYFGEVCGGRALGQLFQRPFRDSAPSPMKSRPPSAVRWRSCSPRSSVPSAALPAEPWR